MMERKNGEQADTSYAPIRHVNPFTVQTPEYLNAAEAMKLFVQTATDFEKVKNVGHAMIVGPRGCGKSMMFRCLKPDCQSLWLNCAVNELPFFGVLVSLKNTVPNFTELQRLSNRNASLLLNEHLLTLFVTAKVIEACKELKNVEQTEYIESVKTLYSKTFLRRLKLCGYRGPTESTENLNTMTDVLDEMGNLCDRLYSGILLYVKGLSFVGSPLPIYEGPLCDYMNFLFPLLSELRKLDFMPKGPIHIYIDDADYLNFDQTMVLNSWISTRTGGIVSLKASTQLQYKTFATSSGIAIRAPHDFARIEVIDIYTSEKGRYLKRVEDIVSRRLEIIECKSKPHEFFPPDMEQEEAIDKIKSEILEEWKVSGRGFRPSDDATRYARPEFIRRLKGTSKSGSTYSYSGFEHLVHISSGLIRYFLESAALMYDSQLSRAPSNEVTKIEPGIQNDEIRKLAAHLMLTEFDDLFKEQDNKTHDEHEKIKLQLRKTKLFNLLTALGGIFHLKLISNDSERRVFSIAFSDSPDQEVQEVLDQGVQFSFFQKASIGNKDGTGRTALYILTRRLAPFFNLDPTSFAGYLFVTNDRIREAIENPDRLLRKVKEHPISEYFEEHQLSLFS